MDRDELAALMSQNKRRGDGPDEELQNLLYQYMHSMNTGESRPEDFEDLLSDEEMRKRLAEESSPSQGLDFRNEPNLNQGYQDIRSLLKGNFPASRRRE